MEFRDIVKQANDGLRAKETILLTVKEVEEYYQKYYAMTKGKYGSFRSFLKVCWVDIEKAVTADKESDLKETK